MLSVDGSGTLNAAIASKPATAEQGAEYRDGQLRAKVSGISGLYERDAKKTLDLDLQLLLRPKGILNGGATTVPLSQPEWGTVTYFVQFDHKTTEVNHVRIGVELSAFGGAVCITGNPSIEIFPMGPQFQSSRPFTNWLGGGFTDSPC